jgi:hypothetical protein
VDCADFAGYHVRDGGGDENIPNSESQGKASLGKESLGWIVRFVGTSELLGALGLILPLVTGILPWLTVLAAIGLTLIQLLAIFTEHLPKKELNVIPINIVLVALAVFVVIGRWMLFS